MSRDEGIARLVAVMEAREKRDAERHRRLWGTEQDWKHVRKSVLMALAVFWGFFAVLVWLMAQQ